MPKLKTNKGAAKRFRKTAKGYKRGQSQKTTHPHQEDEQA